jgi:hypothetical protein
MSEFLQNLRNLIETINRHRWATVAATVIAAVTATTYFIYIKPPLLSQITNTNSIPLPVELAEDLDKILESLLERTQADIVAIAVYRTDPLYEEKYVTFLRQLTNGHTYPIPNTKYFLALDDLYDRYLVHKRGESVVRSFAATNIAYAFSCPFFNVYSNKLLGYVSVEYTSTARVLKEKELRSYCYKSASAVTKTLSGFDLDKLK